MTEDEWQNRDGSPTMLAEFGIGQTKIVTKDGVTDLVLLLLEDEDGNAFEFVASTRSVLQMASMMLEGVAYLHDTL